MSFMSTTQGCGSQSEVNGLTALSKPRMWLEVCIQGRPRHTPSEMEGSGGKGTQQYVTR